MLVPCLAFAPCVRVPCFCGRKVTRSGDPAWRRSTNRRYLSQSDLLPLERGLAAPQGLHLLQHTVTTVQQASKLRFSRSISVIKVREKYPEDSRQLIDHRLILQAQKLRLSLEKFKLRINDEVTAKLRPIKQKRGGFRLQRVDVPSAKLTELVQPSADGDAVASRNRARTTI